MEATNLAKGGIYRRFESKEEITLEVFDFLAKRVFDGINEVIKDKVMASDRLMAILDHYYDRMVMSKNGGFPLFNFCVESDDTDPLIRERVGKGIRVVQDQKKQKRAEGIKKGEIPGSGEAGV